MAALVIVTLSTVMPLAPFWQVRFMLAPRPLAERTVTRGFFEIPLRVTLP